MRETDGGGADERNRLLISYGLSTVVRDTVGRKGFVTEGEGGWLWCSVAAAARGWWWLGFGCLSCGGLAGNLLNAHKVFEKIESPSATVWNQMIRGRARSETPQNSVELYKEMVAKQAAVPDEFTYSYLLSCCAKYRLFREGEQVAQKWLVELDPNNAAGYLVLLANVYATTKRWDDVAAVRQKMVEMDVKKPPGRSWVQMNGDFHDFKADDKTHKHASLIYKMLAEISKHANLEGHERDISELLSGVEE
ncbi:hypothetical protein Q3G72_032003 [Acer saccharum]|nr:hypothetical protein Q3G72_032003 [Acer saccharum]